MARRRLRRIATTVCLFPLVTACSIQKFAIDKVGDALASGGSVYETDEDMELVGDALPFSLKLVESLLAQSPRHRGLLLTACKGFTSYSFIYVHNEADVVASEDLSRARALRARARRLYLRAHRYGIRGLELVYPGIGAELLERPAAAASRVTDKEHLPLLYWTGASLGLAISSARNDASLLARLPEVDALLRQALAIDESWSAGTLHEFEVTFASARPGKPPYDEMEAHFRRALDLSRGRRAGVYVSYAEAVAVPRQNREQFRALLEKALAIDPDEHEEVRLANLVAQKRARWLLSRTDELILPVDSEAPGEGLDNSASRKRQ